MALEAAFSIGFALAVGMGNAEEPGITMQIGSDTYAVAPPIWPWLFLTLAAAQVVAVYYYFTQRWFWLVFAVACASALIGLAAGLLTGGWSWFAMRAVIALLIASSRRAFLD